MGEGLPHRWDLLLRYRFIECIALWEGRLTTRHLVETFGIGRQQASKDINTYNSTVAPNNLRYDKYLKGYEPADDFQPQVTRAWRRNTCNYWPTAASCTGPSRPWRYPRDIPRYSSPRRDRSPPRCSGHCCRLPGISNVSKLTMYP